MVIKHKKNAKHNPHTPKVWIVSVDMGYGHQRAAYALEDIAYEQIITANSDKIITRQEHKLWERARAFYEGVSRLSHIPIIGPLTFGFYDTFQKIKPLFPYRDLSHPNWSVYRLKSFIKKGLCKSIIEYTSHVDIPIITTNFIPALAYHYAGKEVYCIVTDSDVNRIWVPDDPKTCKITYFSSCKHATLRLREYGVAPERIIETGFPLPKILISMDQHIRMQQLLERISNLDPTGVCFQKYKGLLADWAGDTSLKKKKLVSKRPLTITFMVGGAGAQKETGIMLAVALREELLEGHIHINLVAGTKIGVKQYFEEQLHEKGLTSLMGKSINIIFGFTLHEYFSAVNTALITTDCIWTKPSEMSFYTALGIPIIMTPPIGDHERYNRQWLLHIGSGIDEENPKFADHWMSYWLADGRLADCAIQGFIDAPSQGTYLIENYLRDRMGKKGT